MGAEGRGDLALVTLWAYIAALVASLGLPYAHRFWTAHKPDWSSEIFTVTIVFTMLVGGIAVALSEIIVPLYVGERSPEVMWLMRLFLLNIPVLMFTEMIRGMLEGARLFGWLGAARLLFILTQAAGYFFLWMFDYLTLPRAVILITTGQILSLIIMFAGIWRKLKLKWSWDFAVFRKELSYGFSGALFYLLPVLWFYFGQTAQAEFLPKMLKLTVVLGLITSFYGIYQMTFGYPFFEQYWIDNTDLYSSIAIYNAQRALATFSNAEEWGRYSLLGIIVAAGFGMSRSEGKKRVLWFAAAAVLCGMVALSGQRSSIFGVLVGLAILIFTSAKTLGGGALRVGLISVPLLLVLMVVKPPDDDFGYDLDEGDRMTAVLSHTAKGTVNPTGEGSLFARFRTWGNLMGEIAVRPFGDGIGVTTLAAHRENTEETHAIDNYFFSLTKSAGIPALLLIVWILFRAFYFCWRGWRNSEPDSIQADLWRIAMALMSSHILNNFFGTSFVIYSVAPLGWLLIGWISATYGQMENEEETEISEQRTY